MKNIKQSDLVRFVNLTRSARYNEELKEEFRKLGKRILTELADRMGLKKGEFEIRWNAGGIACSGDHTLHTDKVYVALHDNIDTGWFYWRTCNGRKDYSGGRNRIVYWTKFTGYGLEPLADILKVAQAGQWKDPVSGDILCNDERAVDLATKAQGIYY